MMRIAITPGEPAGIGPDLVLQIASQTFPEELVVIGDKQLLRDRAQRLGIPLTIIEFNVEDKIAAHIPGTLKVCQVPLVKPSVCGCPDPSNAAYVLKTLTLAGEGCLKQQFQAVVTGPVAKYIINEAGIPFTGHTEYFAKLTGTQQTVMLLIANGVENGVEGGLKVALASTHVPLNQVSEVITQASLETTIRILNNDLATLFDISQPRLLICGLNPHAGEQGQLGREEIDIMIPVINKLIGEGLQLQGPVSADTAFTQQYLSKADAVLAMYHDQGLPVIKYVGFGRAVNITLGLPIIRTSVDHGTAVQLAGTGQASAQSLTQALHWAIKLAQAKQAKLENTKV